MYCYEAQVKRDYTLYMYRPAEKQVRSHSQLFIINDSCLYATVLLTNISASQQIFSCPIPIIG